MEQPNKRSFAKQPRKRRWQFGIRFLWILSTIIAVVVAYVSFRVRTERLQRETLESFADANVQVLYDYQIYDPESGDIPVTPPGPQFVKRWFGEHIFANVVHLGVTSRSDSWGRTNDLYPLNSIDLSVLGYLKHLRQLSFAHASGIEDLKAMQFAPRLERLRIEQCDSLTTLSGVEQCPKLERLEVINGEGLYEISAIKSLVNLKQLFVSQRKEPTKSEALPLDDASILTDLRQLEQLHLSVPHWKDLDGIEALNRLTNLTLTQARDLEDASEMVALPRLRVLKLFGASSLKRLVIPDSHDLEQVYVSGATSLERIVLAGDQSPITSFTVLDCPNLKDLDELDRCHDLRQVRVSEVKRLVDAAAETPFKNRGVSFEYVADRSKNK